MPLTLALRTHEYGNDRYEKIANQAREEYMGDQMKLLEEHLKIS